LGGGKIRGAAPSPKYRGRAKNMPEKNMPETWQNFAKKIFKNS